MRLDTQSRELSDSEWRLAQSVFGTSLPDRSRIQIGDGLGIDDRPYTWEESQQWGRGVGGYSGRSATSLFTLHVGPDMYPDASRGAYAKKFIHELVHVWQYYHGYWVVSRSLWAQSRFGAGYAYTLSRDDAWDDFNVEQQAHLVEDWYAGGMSASDDRFVFIEKIIRAGVEGGIFFHSGCNKWSLSELARGPCPGTEPSPPWQTVYANSRSEND